MKVKSVQVKKKMLHKILIDLNHLTIYPYEEQLNIKHLA